jgi:hypothetical protein
LSFLEQCSIRVIDNPGVTSLPISRTVTHKGGIHSEDRTPNEAYVHELEWIWQTGEAAELHFRPGFAPLLVLYRVDHPEIARQVRIDHV